MVNVENYCQIVCYESMTVHIRFMYNVVVGGIGCYAPLLSILLYYNFSYEKNYMNGNKNNGINENCTIVLTNELV